MALTSRKKTGHHRTKHYAIISSQGIKYYNFAKKICFCSSWQSF